MNDSVEQDFLMSLSVDKYGADDEFPQTTSGTLGIPIMEMSVFPLINN